MSLASPGNRAAISERCDLPIDGAACVSLVVTDVGVLRVTDTGLEIAEVALGWTSDDIIALAGAPLTVSGNLRQMPLDPPVLTWPIKVYATAAEAISDVPDGAVVNVDGFGGPGGMAHYLMTALRDHGAKGLTMISNTAGIARVARFGVPEGLTAIDHTILVENGQVAKAIASYPVSPSINRPTAFERAYQEGESDLEVSPQGTLAERLRSGGAGVGAFFTPTAVGTLTRAKGRRCAILVVEPLFLEQCILADFCIIRGHKADTLGNVVYKGTSRNFNPVMATAARVTVVEVDEIVEPGELDPDEIVTPGIYVDRIVQAASQTSPPIWTRSAVLRVTHYDHSTWNRWQRRKGSPARSSQCGWPRSLPDGSYVNLGIGIPTLGVKLRAGGPNGVLSQREWYLELRSAGRGR